MGLQWPQGKGCPPICMLPVGLTEPYTLLISSAWSYVNFTVLPAPEATTWLQHLTIRNCTWHRANDLRTLTGPFFLFLIFIFPDGPWTYLYTWSHHLLRAASHLATQRTGTQKEAAELLPFGSLKPKFSRPSLRCARGLWLPQPHLSGYDGHLNHRGRLYGFRPQKALHASTWKSSHYSGGVCYSKACDIRPCEPSSNSREEGKGYSDNQGSITQEIKLCMQPVNFNI